MGTEVVIIPGHTGTGFLLMLVRWMFPIFMGSGDGRSGRLQVTQAYWKISQFIEPSLIILTGFFIDNIRVQINKTKHCFQGWIVPTAVGGDKMLPHGFPLDNVIKDMSKAGKCYFRVMQGIVGSVVSGAVSMFIESEFCVSVHVCDLSGCDSVCWLWAVAGETGVHTTHIRRWSDFQSKKDCL